MTAKQFPTLKDRVRDRIAKFRTRAINSLIETRHHLRRAIISLDDVYRYGDSDDCEQLERLRHEYESRSLELSVHLRNLAIESGCEDPRDLKFIHHGSVYGVEFDPAENEFRPSCLPLKDRVVMGATAERVFSAALTEPGRGAS